MSEFDTLSTDAKVVIGAFFGILITSELTFNRPWIIAPRMRAALDELNTAGYLTAEPLNQMKHPPMVWRPTEKLKNTDRQERAAISRDEDFMERNGFPITDETQPAPRGM